MTLEPIHVVENEIEELRKEIKFLEIAIQTLEGRFNPNLELISDKLEQVQEAKSIIRKRGKQLINLLVVDGGKNV